MYVFILCMCVCRLVYIHTLIYTCTQIFSVDTFSDSLILSLSLSLSLYIYIYIYINKTWYYIATKVGMPLNQVTKNKPNVLSFVISFFNLTA